jgi:hypothetical protein
MIVLKETNNLLADNMNEEEINDLFGHHGWNMETPDNNPQSKRYHQDITGVSKNRSWRGMSSRGYPLFIGSPYKH